MCIYTRRLHIIYSYMLFIIYYRLHIIFDSCYITRAIRYQTVSYQKHYMIEWFFFLTLYHTLFYSILFYLISFHVIITCSKIYHLCVWLWLLSPIFFFRILMPLCGAETQAACWLGAMLDRVGSLLQVLMWPDEDRLFHPQFIYFTKAKSKIQIS